MRSGFFLLPADFVTFVHLLLTAADEPAARIATRMAQVDGGGGGQHMLGLHHACRLYHLPLYQTSVALVPRRPPLDGQRRQNSQLRLLKSLMLLRIF